MALEAHETTAPERGPFSFWDRTGACLTAPSASRQTVVDGHDSDV